MVLYIIYITGRFGPEKILGYAVGERGIWPRETTHVTFDIVGEIDDLADLPRQIAGYEASKGAIRITNPNGIANTQEFRKWQRASGG